MGVWTIGTAHIKDSNHISAFPLKLAMNCVDFFSVKDDWVLDPFMGIGTTLMACQNLGRNAIGIEIVPEYMELAKANLKQNEMNNPKIGLEKW